LAFDQAATLEASMIAKKELLELAKDFGLRVEVVEKDYALGWMLAAIGQHPDTRDTWLFKGGTCLKKCFFETYRFSEDLDLVIFDVRRRLPYTLIHGKQEKIVTLQTARVGKNNRVQVVTIPLEFRFPQGMKDVYIRKVGDDVILSPRPTDWLSFLKSDVRATDDFMQDIEDLPVQERSFT
jgi:virulence-associated protein VagC